MSTLYVNHMLQGISAHRLSSEQLAPKLLMMPNSIPCPSNGGDGGDGASTVDNDASSTPLPWLGRPAASSSSLDPAPAPVDDSLGPAPVDTTDKKGKNKIAGKAQRDEDHQKAVEDNAKVALRECVDALLTLQEVDAKTALEDHATIVLHGV